MRCTKEFEIFPRLPRGGLPVPPCNAEAIVKLEGAFAPTLLIDTLIGHRKFKIWGYCLLCGGGCSNQEIVKVVLKEEYSDADWNAPGYSMRDRIRKALARGHFLMREGYRKLLS